jgi:Rod binding domain-containing protein
MDEIKPTLSRTRQQDISYSKVGTEAIPLKLANGADESQKGKFARAQKEKALTGFESMLTKEVFKSMWSSVDKSNVFGEDSNEAQIYRDMMIQAVSDESAKGKGIGVKAYLQIEMDRSEQAKNQKKGG